MCRATRSPLDQASRPCDRPLVAGCNAARPEVDHICAINCDKRGFNPAGRSHGRLRRPLLSLRKAGHHERHFRRNPSLSPAAARSRNAGQRSRGQRRGGHPSRMASREAAALQTSATWGLVSPWATRRTTSISVGVRLPSPSTGVWALRDRGARRPPHPRAREPRPQDMLRSTMRRGH